MNKCHKRLCSIKNSWLDFCISKSETFIYFYLQYLFCSYVWLIPMIVWINLQ